MVANEEPATAVYGHKISTVVTGTVTGENVVHELTNMDLIMKNHYIRVVYYFRQSEVIDGLTIMKMKAPMFPWLDLYYPVTGRIRTDTTGRPLIKCNDCGVRIIEATCNKTVDEWIGTRDSSRWRQLVVDKVLGPDLHFSPLVYIQFTKFKCGGMSIGYSWAHILGDATSAINCINLWGHLLSGNSPPKSIQLRNLQSIKEKSTTQVLNGQPLSIKQIEPLGDHWLIPNNSKMSTYSVEITDTKLKDLQPGELMQVQPFEILSAVIWYSLAKVRVGREPKLVTICRNSSSAKRSGILSNATEILSVSLDSSPTSIGYQELAKQISRQFIDESKAIHDLVDENGRNSDFLLYGANLTFIDMQDIKFHDLELKDQKPIQVDCSIDGVGDEGAVMVFKNPQRSDGIIEHSGRTIIMILPADQIQELGGILKSEFKIA